MKNFVFAGPSRPFDLILNLVIVVVALFMSLAGLYGVVLDIIAFYAVFFFCRICSGFCIISWKHGADVAVVYTAENRKNSRDHDA